MSVSVWWSVGISATAFVCSWLIGDRRKVGYLLAAAGQCTWLAYAVVTRQWGFIASAVVFGALNVRNYRKWTRLDREAAASAVTVEPVITR